MQSKSQIALSKIWIMGADSISYDNNRFAKLA